MDTFSVRILVVGDSGVGKTTLLETLCRTEPHSSKEKPVSPRGSSRTPRQNITPHSQWTTGCDLHVLVCLYAIMQ
jgi:GTPase SAR1 family protein